MKTEKFVLETLKVEHLPQIMALMKEAMETVEQKDWFAADDEPFMRDVLEKNGFIVGAWEGRSMELAGFFAVVFPDEEENMGKYAGLLGEERKKVVYMDSTAVKGKFRGNKLQQKMLAAAEAELLKRQKENGADCQYRMCSVHPDNSYSLNNMRKAGYEIVARTELYGGLERYVLCKKNSL